MGKDEPGRSGPKKIYTVMIARGAAGRIRSFKISSKTVFAVVVLSLIYLLGSGLVIFDYWNQWRASKDYLEELDRLRVTVREMRQGLFSARENLKLLEDYVKGIQKKGAPGQDVSGEEETADGGVHETGAGRERRGGPLQAQASPADAKAAAIRGSVDIERLKINRKGRVLSVEFRIVNVKRDEGPVSGYIHMIVFHEDARRARPRVFPGVALKDGEPVHYKKGQAFSIKRLKPVKGKFTVDEDEAIPSSLRVLVYDRSGEKIFDRTYEMDGQE